MTVWYLHVDKKLPSLCYFCVSINDYFGFEIFKNISNTPKNPHFFIYFLNLNSCLASETLALLQPIFDSIRAGENASLCSFPMSSFNVTFNHLKTVKRRVNVPKISLSHCHSVRVGACHSQIYKIKFFPCSQLATIHTNHEQVLRLIQINLILWVLVDAHHRGPCWHLERRYRFDRV